MELSKQQAEAVDANVGLTPEPLTAPEPPTAEELDKERNRSRLKKLGGLLLPLAVVASKAKVLFLALIKIKAVTTLGTMFISIVAYGLAFGWPSPSASSSCSSFTRWGTSSNCAARESRPRHRSSSPSSAR
jgi:hypothetical protein